MNLQALSLAFLAATAIGGLAWVFVYPLLSGEKKAEFRFTFDDGIRELVVYTPPQRPDVLAVEPYTQATDAINLQLQGNDAGLRVLGHGRQDTFSLTMETLG